jgi:hypothetical protein
MDLTSPRMPPRISPLLRLVLSISFIILLFNLDALVDGSLHPEIPYFDSEHILTGSIIALITAGLLGLLEIYIRRLEGALDNVKTLEGMLPICASCKKIRTPDNQWHVIEQYIGQRTDATFTHGMCPDCAMKMYGRTFEKP